MMQQNIKTETNIKIPLAFISFALITLVTSQVILFFNRSELLAGLFRIPDIWMSAHFLILGFAVMIAMGAMYQLVPVAFLTPLWSEKFAVIQFFVTVLGITVLSTLLGFHPGWAFLGGALTVTGILLFVFQMYKTLSKQEKAINISKFVFAALICLVLTILAGLLLTLSLAFGSQLNHGSLLLTHITFGLSGWFTLLIMGFSYKLVPMFSLSHQYKNSWQHAAFYCYLFGLFTLIFSYWSRGQILQMIGLFLLLLGFGFFVIDMKGVIQKRVKKRLDVPFQFAVLAIGNGLILHFFAFLASIFAIHSLVLWSWIIYLYLMTWIVFSILGYLYKIVPFLWWTYKYANRAGKENVPLLKDLLNEKIGMIIFILYVIGISGIIVSVALENSILLYLFFGLQTIASTLYSVTIFAVYRK